MDDLVAIGGDFSTDRLYYAYTHGIFPWSQNPIRWYCLHPRAIFEIDGLHISKTVRKKIRQNVYRVTFNQAFREVMKGCAHRVNEITWITEGFLNGYTELHKRAMLTVSKLGMKKESLLAEPTELESVNSLLEKACFPLSQMPEKWLWFICLKLYFEMVSLYLIRNNSMKSRGI
jgi:hypothetical protein